MYQINDVPDEDLEHPAGLVEIWEEIERLKTKVQDQEAEISTLKNTVIDQGQKISALQDSLCQNKIDDFGRLLDYIDKKIENAIKNQAESRPASACSGKTTEQRAKEVERLLKAANGSLSFKVLRSKMGLKANQFSRVISSLDKRRFEVTTRPGTSKEKVLRIKVRWS
jgi:septal ring factor EnvC (AmiA/AmiB activator)